MAEYSEQVKAQALAALLAGQSFAEVARNLSVPIGTLKSWKQRNGDLLAAARDAPVASDASTKKERIGSLLLDYAIETLETLIAQQKAFRSEVWLHNQSAEGAAILHGVAADKVIRLLEGLADDGTGD